MSICTLLTRGGTVTPAGSTDTTASVSWGGGDLHLLAVVSRRSVSVIPDAPTLSGGPGGWLQIGTQPYDSTDPSRKRLTVFAAQSANNGSGAVTIDFNGVTQDTQSWTWVTTDAHGIVQVASNTGDAITTLTATFANDLKVNSATIGFFGADNNTNVFSNGAGFRVVNDNVVATLNIGTEFAGAPIAEVTGTWNGSVSIGALAFELAYLDGLVLDPSVFGDVAGLSNTGMRDVRAWF